MKKFIAFLLYTLVVWFVGFLAGVGAVDLEEPIT